MSKRLNLNPALLLATTFLLTFAVFAEEKSSEQSMPTTSRFAEARDYMGGAAETPYRSGNAVVPGDKWRPGYDRDKCRAVYGEKDCADFEQNLKDCEEDFSRDECAEFRECIADYGYEACLIWVTI